ncbi:MAG: glycoside hydrolase family 127 protein, partial [Bacteroidales bacterium]
LYTFAGGDETKCSISVNGKDYKTDVKDGYVSVSRKWKKNDKVELVLPMPVRTVVADSRVKDDNNRYAVQRGPLIFCAEWADNPDGHVLDLVIDENPEFATEFKPGLLNGTQIVTTKARQAARNPDGSVLPGNYEGIVLIPYHLWNNRGKGEMEVWIPFDKREKSNL